MFDIRRIIGDYIFEKNVATGYEFAEEGMCAVRILENGDEALKPSEGLAGEHFAGFNVISNKTPSSESLTENFIIGNAVTDKVKLTYNNVLIGELRIIDNTDPADSAPNSPLTNKFTFVTTTPANPLEVKVDYGCGLIEFHPSRNGNEVTLFYRYLLTVRLARVKYYDRQQNSNIDPEVYNQIGLYCGTGIIYTDQFDINADYTNVGYKQLKTGPGGKVTVNGNGSPVGAVIKVPGIDYSYLGIQYTVANG